MESRVSNLFRGPSARFTRHTDLDLRLQDPSGAYVQNYQSIPYLWPAMDGGQGGLAVGGAGSWSARGSARARNRRRASRWSRRGPHRRRGRGGAAATRPAAVSKLTGLVLARVEVLRQISGDGKRAAALSSTS
jgi:hypothetical protein